MMNAFCSSTGLGVSLDLCPRRGGNKCISRYPRCTLAPERDSISTQTQKQHGSGHRYRVLPSNLSPSLRPPLPPRHGGIPSIGFFIDRMRGEPALIWQLCDVYGPVFQSNFFLAEVVFIADYHTVCAIVRDTELFQSAGAFPGLDAMLPGNLIGLDGAKHAAARAVLTPAFSSTLFPYYFPFVANRARKTWASVLQDVSRKGPGKVQLDPVFREHYLAITVEMTTGIQMDGEQAQRIRRLFARMQIGAFTVNLGPLSALGRNERDELLGILKDVIKNNFTNRRELIEKLRLYGDDIVKFGAQDIKKGEVDILLVAIANTNLSTEPGAILDESVIENLAYSIMLLWLAGYATSAVTSMSATLELGFDKAQLCERLEGEQNAIIAAANGCRDVTYEQTVLGMPLLDAYLQEILRLHPAAPGVHRIATQDIDMHGYYIPRGTTVFCAFDAAHRDERVYHNASKLVPERFLERPKPQPVLSFGVPGSPHHCIGATFSKTMMKTTFAVLLREYSIKINPNQRRDYKFVPDPAPQSGVIVDSFEFCRT